MVVVLQNKEEYNTLYYYKKGIAFILDFYRCFTVTKKSKNKIMARYTGPKTKISRIFGEPILGNAKWLGKNSNPPGQHGAQRKRKQLGEYALQLREKQS